MTGPGDYGPDMPALQFLDDEAIEAITAGDPVAPELVALASFAAHVRSAGDRPAPPASLELQALITAHAGELSRADLARRVTPPSLVGSPARGAHRRLASIGTKVAGLGLAAKVALGVSVATAGLAGAGATGALPGGADDVVRDAIEAVTPLDLPDGVAPSGGEGPGRRGSTPGPSATGAGAPSSATTGGGSTAGDGLPATDDPRGDGNRSEGGTGAAGGDPGDAPAAEGGDTNEQAPAQPGGSDDIDHAGDDGARYRGERRDDPAAPGQDTPAPAPGDTPGAAGDEGTDPVARDADAAGSTG